MMDYINELKITKNDIELNYDNVLYELSNSPSPGGRFPDDISDVYKKEVRRQLKLHNKSEEEFIVDVDKAIKEEMEFFKDYDERNSDQSF